MSVIRCKFYGGKNFENENEKQSEIIFLKLFFWKLFFWKLFFVNYFFL